MGEGGHTQSCDGSPYQPRKNIKLNHGNYHYLLLFFLVKHTEVYTCVKFCKHQHSVNVALLVNWYKCITCLQFENLNVKKKVVFFFYMTCSSFILLISWIQFSYCKNKVKKELKHCNSIYFNNFIMKQPLYFSCFYF